MAFSLAQVQTILASLVTQYTALAAAPIHSYTINQRSLQKHKLAELRAEIMEWAAVEQDLGGSGGNIALVTFEEPN